MNRIITILIALFSFLIGHAQISTGEFGFFSGIPQNHVYLCGKVVTINSETNDTSVVSNASIKLLSSQDSIKLTETVSYKEGSFTLCSTLNKNYKKLLIKVSAIG